jgi:hypothetical protein
MGPRRNVQSHEHDVPQQPYLLPTMDPKSWVCNFIHVLLQARVARVQNTTLSGELKLFILFQVSDHPTSK